jgi:hypothetical protein
MVMATSPYWLYGTYLVDTRCGRMHRLGEDQGNDPAFVQYSVGVATPAYLVSCWQPEFKRVNVCRRYRMRDDDTHVT